MRIMGKLLGMVLAVALLGAACGGSDGDESGADTTAAATSEASVPAEDLAATTTVAPATTTTTTEAPAFAEPLEIPAAVVTGPVEGDSFYQGVGDITEHFGYTKAEYFFSGNARTFQPVTGMAPDGEWEIEPGADAADYNSRMIVYRPADAADFNGKVIVEWMNVSGGLDAAPNFTMSHVEQMREGYAWVGVSAQARGIEGSEQQSIAGVGFPLHLKGNNPDRYGVLNHPGDSYSYDIFTQAAETVRNPGDVDVLDGLEVETLLGVGESQSAFRLTTYVNAIDPITQVFDGFLIHSRGAGSAALRQDPLPAIPTPEQVLIRTDVRVPVLTFQTDTDMFRLGFLSDRQDDTDNIRLWEVAGTAHGDLYSIGLAIGPVDLGNDPTLAGVQEVAAPIPGIIECAAPINHGPQHWVMNAAIHALSEWAAGGEAPAEVDRYEIEGEGDDAVFALDDLGNPLGGLRTAWVDVPVAVHSGDQPEGGSGFCGLFGQSRLLDADMLADLYPDAQTYVDLVTESVEATVEAGHIRPADAELILANAEANPPVG